MLEAGAMTDIDGEDLDRDAIRRGFYVRHETEGDDDQAELRTRLREARIAAGYKTASDFSSTFNLNRTTYSHHERGRRGLDIETVIRYASYLQVPPAALLFDDDTAPRGRRRVPVVGVFGAGGLATDMPELPAVVDVTVNPLLDITETVKVTVEPTSLLPDASRLVSRVITTPEMQPVLRLGDTVYYHEIKPDRHASDRLHTLDCAVMLEDRRVILGRVYKQGDGKVTLHRYNSAPIPDMRIIGGEPIELIQRKAHTQD